MAGRTGGAGVLGKISRIHGYGVDMGMAREVGSVVTIGASGSDADGVDRGRAQAPRPQGAIAVRLGMAIVAKGEMGGGD